MLPSIRKTGQYKYTAKAEDYDTKRYTCFSIKNESDLHYKVVDLIRKIVDDPILVAGLGELQKTPITQIDAWKRAILVVNQTSLGSLYRA